MDVSYFHVFTYSERPDTVAIELPNPVPMNIRKDRNQQLRNLSMKKQNFFREQFVGQTRKVLWEGQDKEGMIEGFTEFIVTKSYTYYIDENGVVVKKNK